MSIGIRFLAQKVSDLENIPFSVVNRTIQCCFKEMSFHLSEDDEISIKGMGSLVPVKRKPRNFLFKGKSAPSKFNRKIRFVPSEVIKEKWIERFLRSKV